MSVTCGRLVHGSCYGACMLLPEIDTLLIPGDVVCVVGASDALCARWLRACAERGGAVVSPKAQQELYERVLRADDTDYSDRLDPGPTVEALLCAPGGALVSPGGAAKPAVGDGRAPTEIRRVAELLGLDAVWERGYRLLSTGEVRRLSFARLLLSRSEEIALEAPFEGLDASSRSAVEGVLGELVASGRRVLVCMHQLEDVPKACTRLVVLEEDRVDVLVHHPEASHLAELHQLRSVRASAQLLLPWQESDGAPAPEPLLRMRNVGVRYSDVVQFQGFDWELRAGEHTVIVGPNGSGKSTLMQLISGDHPQCYSNDIRVLGYQRGSGESIWDVKRRLGLVSGALHRDYRVACSAKMAVVSGLFDSIGVYCPVSQQQCRLALRWLEAFHMADLAERSFLTLSYAQQRLILIARALIKQPPLLILDEPTIGLGSAGQALLMEAVHRLTAESVTTILMVTHREAEREGFVRALRFRASDTPGVRFRIAVDSEQGFLV